MKPSDVQYVTDGPVRWAQALDLAVSLELLTTALHEWRELFPDAWEARPKDSAEFCEWHRGLTMERGYGKRKKFAGVKWAERYGAVLLPATLIRAAAVAEQYKVPWGLAYLRMVENGLLR